MQQSAMARYAAVVAVVAMVVHQTSTLTTFGTNKNTDNDQPKPPPPAIVRGRDCRSDNDCNGILNTICMKDPRDRKTRCLCVNKSPPTNGACPRTPKALKSVCAEDKECMEGAHCTPASNATSATTKACMCKEGYMEEDHMCNTGRLSVFPSIASLITAISLLRLATSHD